MNTTDFANLLKDKANLGTVENALEHIDNVFQILAETLNTGENVTIRKFGTFRVEHAKNARGQKMFRGRDAWRLPQISLRFVPDRIFDDIGTEAGMQVWEKEESKYGLIIHLPEILDTVERYRDYAAQSGLSAQESVIQFFKITRKDTENQRTIKVLTHLALSWIDDPSLPEYYMDKGMEWTDEFDIICNVVNELLVDEDNYRNRIRRVVIDRHGNKIHM